MSRACRSTSFKPLIECSACSANWLFRYVQIEKLAAGISHANNFGHAFLEAGLVASKIVAHQLAVPRAEEVTRMLARSAGAEVVNHSLE